MSRLIVIILGLMAAFNTVAAQDQVLITGKVTDNGSHEPVPFVNIIDKKNNTGTSSNIDGTFQIKIGLGDTLLFSAIGYSKYSLVITQQLQEVYININLDQVTMELKPVKVFAYRDMSSLKRAIIKMNMPASEGTEMKLDLPPVSNTTMGQGGTIGVVLNGPLTGLINGLGINKEYNELKKLQKFQHEDFRRKMISEKYNPEIVKRWTNLEGEELSAFMEFCKLSEEFILSATEYDLAVAVHTCLNEYENPQD